MGGMILSPERDPQESTRRMGDGPVVWVQRGAGLPASAPCSPRNGMKRGDDRKVLSGIIHGNRKGLRRVDAPAAGPHKTLYTRFRPW